MPAGFILKTLNDKSFGGKEMDFPGPLMRRDFPNDNDMISSVKLVDAVTGVTVFDAPQACADSAVVFEDSFFQKLGLIVDVSIPNLSNTRFNYYAEGGTDKKTTVNDRISSICVPAGKTLTLFRDNDFDGPSVTFVGPAFRTIFNTMTLNDAVISIRVQ